MNIRPVFLLLGGVFLLFSSAVFAQTEESAGMLKQANNPLASIKTFSVHNYYTNQMYGNDQGMNSMWFRYAHPIGRVLLRASLPVNTLPMPNGKCNSGLGDLNVLAAYLFTKPTSANQIGIGPVINAPTATSRALGSGKWQAGVALAGYFASSNTLQIGFLGTWQHSFAGNYHANVQLGALQHRAYRYEVSREGRADAQFLTFQPILMWQLGKGFYARSSGIATFDLENDNYYVPLGLGVGKILKMNQTVFNLFLEPQFTAWHKGYNIPKTQLLIGINTQF